MSEDGNDLSAWSDAMRALALFAVDPDGLGGVAVAAHAGPVRDRWLALLRAALPEGVPWRRMPASIGDGRLLGGLDLGATLQAGRVVAERGLLAEADGGVIVVPMAERLPAGTASRLAAVLDSGSVVTERDGIAAVSATRIGVVALDESVGDEEVLSAALSDRLAFRVGLDAVGRRETAGDEPDRGTIGVAREALGSVLVPDALLETLCATAAALGIDSPRAGLLAVRAARAAAALAGRPVAEEADAALAARLVLAPRATRLPARDEQPPSEDQAGEDRAAEENSAEEKPRDEAPDDGGGEGEDDASGQALGEMILEAARAAIPTGLLARIQAQGALRVAQAGRLGTPAKGGQRGRPVGVRAGIPGGGQRLSLIETLRAAAPWQRLRRASGSGMAISVRRDDFRVVRCEQKSRTTTIFVVDASGSSALNRLAEAKGAVELLLAESYARRDQVAVVAFRGKTAQLLLPPTRSLVRAKRSLATLPGGGGTPLASGIAQGLMMALAERRAGAMPSLVLLTDGRGNVARDGTGGRARAGEDAIASARAVRGMRVAALLVDTSPRPAAGARLLAQEMGALYLPLPYADSASLSRGVRAAAGVFRP